MLIWNLLAEGLPGNTIFFRIGSFQEYLPDSMFCRICGQRRDVAAPAHVQSSPQSMPWEATRERQSLPSREPVACQTPFAAEGPIPFPRPESSPQLTLPQPTLSQPRFEPSHPSPRRSPIPSEMEAPRWWRAREAKSQERAPPVQDEWYQTLMSRLQRLGEGATSMQQGEPIAAPPSSLGDARMVRSSSREALNAKLRELGMERPEPPTFRADAHVPSTYNPTGNTLLNDLPHRAFRRDSYVATFGGPRREELIF
ncbi:unnamed protein product [Effrenium voratum]|uniref:Uncharacterized protein n=1 Tax=Effrenium voratum TaxID=2562239 RepID=A0AA36MRH8_9DINO|nr:unnamed protein product [Effrenium voratum]CAJ1378675.1 unnamed protein product [Effrenium voratum]CAJ1420680.1 unnamed protein product [Effrenium voratum]